MPQSNSKALAVIEEVRKAVIGKDSCIVKVMAAILAGGHILIEDIPGVGKTTMAMAFSKAMALTEHRVQFTPDVMPADLMGFSLYRKETGDFIYQPGSVMCNLFLADEINRTSPKTQSALLEVMEEGYVSVDGKRIKVPQPFIVIATQNPVGSAGTQMLPSSQMDRFLIRISLGYPEIQHEIAIVKNKLLGEPDIKRVMDGQALLALRAACGEIYMHDVLYSYIGALVEATRKEPLLELGLSPRGTIALAKMAAAIAFLRGRDYATPEDVSEVFSDIAAHRICPSAKAVSGGFTAGQICTEILVRVKKPGLRSSR